MISQELDTGEILFMNRVAFSDELDRKEINKLNKGYVLIEGTFNKDRHGHIGLFGGEIYQITRIIKWGD